MDQIGPYRLETPIGEGGMGVVWRATHLETGDQVALKTVRLLHARQLDGIRREVRALSRIHHPGIVRILDQGVTDGAPWYAMELVEGRSLRHEARTLTSTATTRFLQSDLNALTRRTTLDFGADDPEVLAEEPEEPEPIFRPPAANGFLNEILTLVRALCDPIGFLHGEGIVHRDLKPENVLVLPDRRPVLVDFGLVSRGAAGRETLSLDAMLHGTVSYMSPEQIRGELVDARADLYALGVILYEVVTGRLPFVGNSVGATLYQTLQHTPLPPSARVTGVPGRLEDLIVALLSKRREERPGYTSDVAEVLEACGATPPDYEVPRPKAYLYRPRFSGRDAAIETLKHSMELGRGVLLLGGESGVGKTRMALEFAHTVASRGRAVLVGECQPADAASPGARGGPLHPLRPALQTVADRCLQGAQGTIEKLLDGRGPLLARYQPALLAVPGVADAPQPERLEPDAERLRTLRWLTLTLRALGDQAGTVLLLDDVEYADELTLAWLTHVARADPEGLLVVATHGLDGLPDGLERLRNAPEVVRIEIRALDREAVARVAGDLLAIQVVPEGLVEFLYGASDGNPLLVAEYLRAAVEVGALVRRDGRWHLAADPDADEGAWNDLPVPRRLEDLVLSRLGRLTPHALEALEAAAVAGGDLEPAWIEGVAWPDADPQDSDWLDAVTELLEAHVVVAEDDRLRFSHDRVRDVIYDALDPQRRTELHGAVARALEDSGRTRDAGVIGHHWLRAGELERAGVWTLRGAREALDQVSHADAERLLRTYLTLANTPELEQIQARIALGANVLATLGRNAEALEILEEARQQARRVGDARSLADVTAALGDVASSVGRLADALALHRDELAIRRKLAEPGPTARALLSVARGQAASGGDADLHELTDEALSLARASGDPVLEGEVLVAQAELEPSRSSALTRLEAAKQRFDTAGVKLQQAGALERMAGLAEGRAALDLYQQALALYRAIGERVLAGRVLARLGRVQHADGRATESYASFAEALEIFREAGHHRFRGQTLHELGTQLRLDGRLREAEALNRQAVTLLTVVGDRPWQLRARLELARIALLNGSRGQAATWAERALALAETIEQPEAAIEALHLQALALEPTDPEAAAAIHKGIKPRAAAADRPDLRARAEVWLVRLDRLMGRPPTLPKERLEAALDRLTRPDRHVARCVAWCELGHVAIAAGESSDQAWMMANDAHHEPLRLDSLAGAHVAELQAARAAT